MANVRALQHFLHAAMGYCKVHFPADSLLVTSLVLKGGGEAAAAAAFNHEQIFQNTHTTPENHIIFEWVSCKASEERNTRAFLSLSPWYTTPGVLLVTWFPMEPAFGRSHSALSTICIFFVQQPRAH